MLTRRRFLERCAAAAAALSAGFSGMAFAAGPRSALRSHHRRSLKALVQALAGAPGSRFAAGDADRVVDVIARDFAGSTEATRRSIELALDELDDGRGPGWFASLPAAARLASLRRRVKRSNADAGSPPPEYLIQGAIRLAASAVYPVDEPVAVALAP